LPAPAHAAARLVPDTRGSAAVRGLLDAPISAVPAAVSGLPNAVASAPVAVTSVPGVVAVGSAHAVGAAAAAAVTIVPVAAVVFEAGSLGHPRPGDLCRA
jgi:hypothetical protein